MQIFTIDFLHGDIDDIGDIANFANIAMSFFRSAIYVCRTRSLVIPYIFFNFSLIIALTTKQPQARRLCIGYVLFL